ncbi:hypothetical protein FHQ18_03580 [Deferribacter autotrophicus]|uniref:Uncharacterized protein n=1 Tax=Deferribacter autotrophicus TaxID=500465 RepID=A0A5A8F6I3_9BACT|nr:hypothetical protein [Deferribacter autotrophicus]KAA0259043.1 hypothetical protein FHQ18_03580 [Deferribacter autotrophicus]
MMKKMYLFIMIIILLSTFVFAAAWDTDGVITIGSGTTADNVTLSNNVYGIYATPTDNTTYSAATMNTLGTKKYGGASDSTVIYYSDCANTPCGTGENAPNLTGSSSDFSGWTELGK